MIMGPSSIDFEAASAFEVELVGASIVLFRRSFLLHELSEMEQITFGNYQSRNMQ